MASLGNLVINVGANTSDLNKALGQVNREVGRTTGNIQALGKRMSMAFSAPLAAIAGTSFKVFADFEQQMAKVKAVSGATADQFKALSDNATMLGSTTRFTSTEVAQLQTEYAKLGFTADEITKVTAATLALAQATDTDLARAAEVAGSTLRAFGLDASQTGMVTDVMAASFSSTAMDMESFAEAMKYVAPVAKAAGVSIEETTAMLGTLANAGIKGSMAGTSLRRIITDLGAGAEPVGEKIQSLSAKGLTLTDAFDEVGRTAQSSLLVLSAGANATDALTVSLGQSEGAAQRMADTMDNTTVGSMKKMQSAIEGAQLAIGKALAPAIAGLMDMVTGLASSFANLSGTTQGIIIVMGGLLAAAGPILVMLPQMVLSFNLLSTAMTSRVIPAILRMNAVLMANPYALAAAGLAALGAVIYQFTNTATAASIVQDQLKEKMIDAGKEAGGQMATVSKLTAVVQDETKSEYDRLKALEELQAISPNHFKNLDLETLKTQDLTKAVDSYKASLLEAAKTKAMQKQLEDIESQLLALESGGNLQEANWFAKSIAYLSDGAEGLEKMQKRFNNNAEAALKSQREMLLQQLTATDQLSTANQDSVQSVATAATTARTEVEKLKDSFDDLYNAQQAALGQFDTKNDLRFRSIQQGQAGGAGPNLTTVDPIEEQSDDGWLEQATVDYKTHTDAKILAEQEFQDKLSQTLMLADNLGQSFGSTFGSMITGSVSAGEAMKGMGKQVLKTLIGIAKANAVAVFSSPSNPANLASGGLAMPAVIAGGLALVEGLIGAIAFADGGIVSGPTLGLVGEYAGARNNPEVIAPLDKLQSMIGGSGGGATNVTVTGRISGNDIVLAQESGSRRLDRSRNRTR